MKGIILAGGLGTRLYPLTLAVSKQLLPVYDKPMVYYPLSMLMLAGIHEVLVISTKADIGAYKNLLGDGRQWGMQFSYATQNTPKGLPDAFIIAEKFIANDTVCLILGDNIFFGTGISEQLRNAAELKTGAIIFAYPVKDPQRYGVVELDENYKVISLEEKPQKPKSNYAIPGMYLFDEKVASFAKSLKPSTRGELEITDLHRLYLKRNELQVALLGRGIAWLDAGTHESLLQASSFVQAVEERQGLMIACPEEIAFRMGYISRDQLLELANKLKHNQYGLYLLDVIKESDN